MWLESDGYGRTTTISPPYYCEIERGTRQPDMAYSMMEKIANALDLPVQKIIDAESEYKASIKKAPHNCTTDDLLGGKRKQAL